MKNFLFNLQLFAEGGSAGAGAEGGSDNGGAAGTAVQGVATPSATESAAGDSEDTRPSFHDMVKKGGEYHDEFSKEMQGIINKRFGETQSLKENLDKVQPVLELLSEKYGADVTDIDSIVSAIEDDESFYEQEALEKGLTVEQLKAYKQLERENARFRAAEEEAERRANTDKIYSEWLQQSDDFAQKYNMTDFDLNAEVEASPDFARLLQNGVSVESAYMAIHFDDIAPNIMATTAKNVKEQLSNSIASRQSRPTENGVSSNQSNTFKTDVKSLTKKERANLAKQARLGANITF